jgi:hypothetical protein
MQDTRSKRIAIGSVGQYPVLHDAVATLRVCAAVVRWRPLLHYRDV